MKRILMTTTALLASATVAQAGGLERTTQSPAILFEDGRYFELSFGIVSPDNTGTLGGNDSGDMFPTYSTLGLAYKADLNDTLSYAIIFDQPYGADTAYPTGTGYDFEGATAEVDSNALTGILQYNMGNGGSVYGGLRAQTLSASADLASAIPGGYTVDSNTDAAIGYVLGAAYERPEIALRVALTYHSETSHDLTLTETSGLFGSANDTDEVIMPQALNLEFQSGVAEGTLVFGSVRWVEWSETVVNPTVYDSIPDPTLRPLVFFEDDRVTYTLGAARRLNETWSVLGSVGYEENTGSDTGNLGPVDGFKSISLGAVYTKDNMKITGGIRYVDIGDATSFSGAEFTDNHAIAAGLRVGWSF